MYARAGWGGQKQRLTATEEDGVSWFSDAVAVVKVDVFDIILLFLKLGSGNPTPLSSWRTVRYMNCCSMLRADCCTFGGVVSKLGLQVEVLGIDNLRPDAQAIFGGVGTSA